MDVEGPKLPAANGRTLSFSYICVFFFLAVSSFRFPPTGGSSGDGDTDDQYWRSRLESCVTSVHVHPKAVMGV